MSIVKKVNIGGIQNLERYFAEYVFTPVGKHDLEKVEYRDNEVTLYFDENENPSAKNFLKQMSLKKYADEGLFIQKTAVTQKFQTHIAKVPTDKHILFFFSEKCREKKGLFW